VPSHLRCECRTMFLAVQRPEFGVLVGEVGFVLRMQSTLLATCCGVLLAVRNALQCAMQE
jgi:hypothetical protein